MRAPRARAIGWAVLVALMLPFASAHAQSTSGPAQRPTPTTAAPAAPSSGYVLGIEDVLQISVYLHPELERTTAIDANGDVTFAPIGSIKAAGLTPKQLSDRISDRLSNYLRQTTAVTVTVNQYLSRSVYVSGAVAKPGRYGFEVIPGLTEVIGQAGGAQPGSDLSRVQIVRNEGTQRRTIAADVASTLRNGDISQLPALRPGDQITIPMGIGMAQYSGSGGGAGVIGEVGKPGLYPVGEGQDVWTLLAVAGGPTRQSKLSDIRVITREGGGATVVKLDLKEMLQRGTKQIYQVKDGDVIYVPQTSASKFISVFGGLSTLTSITLDVFQIMVLSDILKNQEENP
jgi:polysaccharide export outer membrane protein